MNMNQAVGEFKSFKKAMRGVMAIAEVLEEIVSLENSVVDAQKTADVAIKEKMAVKMSLDEVRQNLNIAKEQLVKVKEDWFLARADNLKRAQEMQKSAKEEADQIVTKASEQAVATRDRMSIQVQAHESKMRGWLEEEKKMETEISLITLELRELRKRIG